MFFSYPGDFKELRVVPGVVHHVVSSERIMLVVAEIEPNTSLPPHTHAVEEQMGMVLEGELEMTVGGETRKLKKGDAYIAPPNVEHGGRTGEKPAIYIDIFSPPREDFK